MYDRGWPDGKEPNFSVNFRSLWRNVLLGFFRISNIYSDLHSSIGKLNPIISNHYDEF